MFEHEEKCKFNFIPVSCADSGSLNKTFRFNSFVTNLIIEEKRY